MHQANTIMKVILVVIGMFQLPLASSHAQGMVLLSAGRISICVNAWQMDGR